MAPKMIFCCRVASDGTISRKEKTYPIKVKCVGPDHPQPVEGVQPEHHHQAAHDDAPCVSGVRAWFWIWSCVVVPPLSFVVPFPRKSRIDDFDKYLVFSFTILLHSNSSNQPSYCWLSIFVSKRPETVKLTWLSNNQLIQMNSLLEDEEKNIKSFKTDSQ